MAQHRRRVLYPHSPSKNRKRDAQARDISRIGGGAGGVRRMHARRALPPHTPGTRAGGDCPREHAGLGPGVQG